MIRDATTGDATQLLEIYEPIVRDTAISFEIEAPSEIEMAERVEGSLLWLVWDGPEGITGYAYASPFHQRAAYKWSVEVSIYLAEAARGAGVGSRLLTAALQRLTARGFVNAFAGIALPNPASVRLFESFGFEQIALQKEVGFKFQTWHDVGWWQRKLCDPTIPPPDID